MYQTHILAGKARIAVLAAKMAKGETVKEAVKKVRLQKEKEEKEKEEQEKADAYVQKKPSGTMKTQRNLRTTHSNLNLLLSDYTPAIKINLLYVALFLRHTSCKT